MMCCGGPSLCGGRSIIRPICGRVSYEVALSYGGQPEPELTRNVAVCPTPLPPGFSLNLVKPVLPSCSVLVPLRAN